MNQSISYSHSFQFIHNFMFEEKLKELFYAPYDLLIRAFLILHVKKIIFNIRVELSLFINYLLLTTRNK
jgi:hypothetical protein